MTERSDLGALTTAEQIEAPAKRQRKNNEPENIWAALLATAVVRLQAHGKISPPLRALCDSGSQANMISTQALKRLQWPTQQCNARFNGINGITGRPHSQKVCCDLLSRLNDQPLATIELVAMPQLSSVWLPRAPIPAELVPEEITGQLADPNLCTPAPFDILLGAGVWAIVILDGSRINQFGIALQPSRLGWLMFGGGIQICQEITCAFANETMEEQTLDKLLRQFWEIEEISLERKRTAEQSKCEDIFMQTHTRLADGRYQVTIPLRNDIEDIGSSRAVALHRFHQLERRFARDPDLKTKYVETIEELLRNDQMRPVDRPPIGWCYHIPHHPVTKKFRVVFDASCRTNKSISLNEAQLVGEKLQEDLAPLIMRFRCNPVAVTADIKKMYLQVKIHPEQWDLQRIIWRPAPNCELKEYWLTGVTFGLSSAPHCAVRAMIQGARDMRTQFPKGVAAVERDFYMDDCLTGAQNEESARQLCTEMDALLSACKFPLDKWRSNKRNVVPGEANRQTNEALELSEFSDTTVLGLRWLPETDQLMFKFQQPPALSAAEMTMRKLLSQIAQLFDPNGYIGPVIVVAKILMQKLWAQRIKWDAQVPAEVYAEWQGFQQQLPLIIDIQLPRWLGLSEQRNVTLHGFSDASMSAYGAVLYARVETTAKIECTLIAAKSRVAPLKTVTIPRLELCAALLLSELVDTFKRTTKTAHYKTTLWTDSKIVLAWLVKEPATLKIFVNNRVQQIQQLTNEADWRHVSSSDNPADLLSRGVTASELRAAKLWWHGPHWLAESPERWPPEEKELTAEAKESMKKEAKHHEDIENAKLRPIIKSIAAMSITVGDTDLLSRASSANRLVRITAWIFRFKFNAFSRFKSSDSAQTKDRQEGGLSYEEINAAQEYWVREEQGNYYAKELKALRNNQNNGIDKTSSIGQFDPRIDKNGILRVGGRLDRALLPYEQRHPALLPDVSWFAKLLIRQAHERTMHGGQRQMTAYLRQKFWITNLTRAIKTSNSRCIECTRQRQASIQQMMGELPADRIRPCRPFEHSGVDYAGPYQLKARSGRCNILEKKFIAVFVCMATKAVHLELVEGLSADDFIQGFMRFTSIRGPCARLWSDNGTNFKLAEKELAQMLHSWRKADMGKALQALNTEWRFTTPYAPHQGGLWEAAVKSMKYHLRRVIGAHRLTSNDFRTVLCQTSAVMNSRPLSALSNDPDDFHFLTPAHFLIGGPIVQPFGANVAEIPDNRLKHLQHIQKMSQVFWKSWQQDYLHELQQRPKWRKANENLKIGDLVIVRDENIPPTLWKAARVVEVMPGRDGLVRNVRLRMPSTDGGKNISGKRSKAQFLERPIQKLCRLPVEVEDEHSRAQCVEDGIK